MKSYANRGRTFETLLNSSNDYYQKLGIACVHKVPTEFLPLRNAGGKIVGCKVEHKSCVDYLGRWQEVPVAIEAKHTEQGRINFDRVEQHQAKYLDDFCIRGAFGLVVVSYSMKRFYAVPWPFWKAARDTWLSYKVRGMKVSVDAYGMKWNTPGGASISPEQMLPEWEAQLDSMGRLLYLDSLQRLDPYNNIVITESNLPDGLAKKAEIKVRFGGNT